MTITDYQTLPEAKSWLHHSWSGDLLSAVLYYLPKGTKPDVLSFWGPDTNGVVQNDLLWILAKRQEARARARVPQLHARREERLRQLRAVQRLHAAAEQRSRRERLVKQGLIPKTLAPRRPAARPVREQPGAARAQRRRRQRAGRTPGRSSRPAEVESPLDLARAGPARRRVAVASSSSSRSTPCCASRSATRTRSRSPCRSGTRSTGTSATCSRRCATSGTNGPFLHVFLRTLRATSRSRWRSRSLIGYPVAYYTARHAGRWRALVLLLLVLPFWINYLMRMLAWINLLSPDGWGTRFLQQLRHRGAVRAARAAVAGRRAGSTARPRPS